MDDLIEQINDNWDTHREKADDIYWKEINSHAAFCDNVDESSELSADMLGLQNIKFDSETPYDNAINYKDEGNHYFKKKNYILALYNYQKALSLKIDNNELNSILYTNKAACQFNRCNYRMCIDDCKIAIKLNGKYVKSYWRAASAADKINKFDEGLEFCENGLKVDVNNKDLLNLREKLVERKNKERQSHLTLVSRPMMIIENILKNRGVVINEEVPTIEIPRQHLCQSFIDGDDNIHFNVLILYPEYGQTDFLQDVVETASLMDCLSMIFTVAEKTVDWDLNNHYRLYNNDRKLALQTYYRNNKEEMIQVALSTTMKSLLTREGFQLRSDLVIDINVVSNLSKEFLINWNKDSRPLNLD